MLYKNLVLISFVTFTGLHRTNAIGETYHVALSGGHQECPSASGSNDTCHIWCDVENKDTSYSFSCGDSEECHFHCEETKCAIGGTINVQMSTKILFVDSYGDECMKGATAYTPSYGNAMFTLSGNRGFKGMNIISNENARDVFVRCDAEISLHSKGDDCQDMTIEASNANWLNITVANDLEFGASKVYCPYSSTLRNEPPCILNVIKGGMVRDVRVSAPQGTPHDLWVNDDNTGSISDLWVLCDDSMSEYPFTAKSRCWNNGSYGTVDPTHSPTPTTIINPSVYPRPNEPSIQPSTYQTRGPTTATADKKEDAKPIDLEIIWISIGALLVLCCICVFLCYWYRREKMWKELRHVVHDQERGVHLNKPLMNDSPQEDQNGAQIFDSYDANKSFVPAVSIKTKNSWDTPNAEEALISKRTLSLCDDHASVGESMDVKDLDVVAGMNEFNETHGNALHKLLCLEVDTDEGSGVTGDGGEMHDDDEEEILAPGIGLEISDHNEENDLATSLPKQNTQGFIE